MRLYELEQKPSGRPEVFLDMDGVLADFFAEYATLAGLPAGSSYRDVPPAKNDPTLNQMVGTDFFYRLPKFASADRLVAMVVRIFGSYSICSSPLRGDHENSGVQKTRWLQANLNPQPRRILIESRKERHAVQSDGTPNILIDDRKDNIIKWEAAGGVGIKYQADEDGLDVVAAGLRRAVEILRGLREPDRLALTPSLDRGMPVTVAPDKKITESTFREHQAQLQDFVQWVCKKINLQPTDFHIRFSDSKQISDMTHTGSYSNGNNQLWIYTGNRNLVDIMRTVAHELVHRKQDTQDRVKGVKTGPGHPLEQEADVVAGTLMKLYVKKYPEIVE